MSDTDQQQDQNEQRDADQDDHQQDADQTQDGKTERDTTLSRLSEERREARERARKAEARLAELEARQREADEAKAREEGQFKELLEQREAELAEIQKQLAARDLADTKRSIARKHNLADDAFEFITGEDEEAIEASVKKLAKLAARAADTDTDAGKRDSSGRKSKQSDSLLVNYKFGTRR